MGNANAKRRAMELKLQQEEEERVRREQEEILRREREEAERRWLENAKRVKNRICFVLQAHGRGYIQRRKYKRLRDLHNRRFLIVKEMLATEQSYVRSLGILVDLFMKPLQTSLQSLKPIISFEQIRSIFSDVETIKHYNTNLMQQLVERVSKWTLHQYIGDVFLDIVDYLKVYIQYVNNYSSSTSTLGALKADETFNAWLDERQSKSECEGKDLASFLIMPIQRLPRYVLLLQDLLQHTPDDHRDHQAIAEATRKIKEVATLVNERKRETESFQKKIDLCARIVPNQEDFMMAPHIVYLREGVLKIDGDKYMFVLLNTVLMKCKEKSPKLKLLSMFDVTQLKIVDVSDDKALKIKNAFVIEHTGTRERFVVSSKTPDLKREWIADINEAMESELLKQKSRIDGARVVLIETPSLPRTLSKQNTSSSINHSPSSTKSSPSTPKTNNGKSKMKEPEISPSGPRPNALKSKEKSSPANLSPSSSSTSPSSSSSNPRNLNKSVSQATTPVRSTSASTASSSSGGKSTTKTISVTEGRKLSISDGADKSSHAQTHRPKHVDSPEKPNGSSHHRTHKQSSPSFDAGNRTPPPPPLPPR